MSRRCSDLVTMSAGFVRSLASETFTFLLTPRLVTGSHRARPHRGKSPGLDWTRQESFKDTHSSHDSEEPLSSTGVDDVARMPESRPDHAA